MPGPASSEGKCPPTNPAIPVRFSKQAKISFALWQKNCATSIYSNISCKNRRRNLLEKESRFFTNPLSERELSPNKLAL